MRDGEHGAALPILRPIAQPDLPVADATGLRLQLDGRFRIGSFPLHFGFDFAANKSADGGLTLFAYWANTRDKRPDLQEIADLAGITVPDDAFEFPLAIRQFGFSYNFRGKTLSATLEVDSIGKLLAEACLSDSKKFRLVLEPTLKADLRQLPVIGREMREGDQVGVEKFAVGVTPAKVEICIVLSLVLGGKDLDITIPYTIPRSGGLRRAAAGENDKPDKPKVYWAEVDKKIGFLNIYRVGASFADGAIALYLDAGFQIAMITAVFYDMRLAIPLASDKKTSFSLSGLALGLDKPPLTLSGGLYIDAATNLYNGELKVGFGKYALTALGSYGLIKTKGRDIQSFFAFLMVSLPLGGPPMLFVTGLAAGFGINRSLTLPDKPEEVASFPLVAASMGGEKWPKIKTPAEMLRELGTLIAPAEDAFFITAGVRFMSFGLLDSLVLLTVEFGKKFVISILGLSVLAIPAKVKKPFAYACLALKAVYSSEDGIISILACLTNDSYVFDKNCKLTGGFALCIWTKGDHAGDFVVTLGGYHPRYDRKHYPLVNPIGINWKISDNLSLSAGAYFALTPNAVMAGGRLSITYESGKLKAWFIAYADILLQWKPFYYDIAIGIRLGASYRVDFLFIHHTFTIELGADLHLWGPEFSGTVSISLFIISFTVSFGANSSEPPALGWADFRDEFLPKPGEKERRGLRAAGKTVSGRLCTINPLSGIESTVSDDAGNVLYYRVDSDFLAVEVTSLLPSTTITVEGRDDSLMAQSAAPLRIAPMGGISYTATLRVSLAGSAGGQVRLDGAAMKTRGPGALWGDKKRNLLDNTMVEDLASGVTVRPVRSSPSGLRPEQGAYSLAVLTANQPIAKPELVWEKPAYPANGARTTDPFGDLRRSIADPGVAARRAGLIRQVAFLGVEDDVEVEDWKDAVFLYAEPVFATTGSRARVGGGASGRESAR